MNNRREALVERVDKDALPWKMNVYCTFSNCLALPSELLNCTLLSMSHSPSTRPGLAAIDEKIIWGFCSFMIASFDCNCWWASERERKHRNEIIITLQLIEAMSEIASRRRQRRTQHDILQLFRATKSSYTNYIFHIFHLKRSCEKFCSRIIMAEASFCELSMNFLMRLFGAMRLHADEAFENGWKALRNYKYRTWKPWSWSSRHVMIATRTNVIWCSKRPESFRYDQISLAWKTRLHSEFPPTLII